MARITVEDCLEKENNRFALVQLAAKRTKQLLSGARSLVQTSNKAVVTALREIADSRVRFMTPEEAEVARQLAEQEQAVAAQRQSELVGVTAVPSPDSILISSTPASTKGVFEDVEDVLDDEDLDDEGDDLEDIDEADEVEDDSDEDSEENAKEKDSTEVADDKAGRNGDGGTGT